ncbi:MAG: winged helix-turn-helix domain-containing protein [Cytophagaceae bacterium]
MKNVITNLNKAFENRVRLGIMSVLMVNDWVDFNVLKETLDVTDGNLASHLSALEKIKYIEVRKSFIGKKPNTSYAVSKEGRKAFREHLDALEAIIKGKDKK